MQPLCVLLMRVNCPNIGMLDIKEQKTSLSRSCQQAFRASVSELDTMALGLLH